MGAAGEGPGGPGGRGRGAANPGPGKGGPSASSPAGGAQAGAGAAPGTGDTASEGGGGTGPGRGSNPVARGLAAEGSRAASALGGLGDAERIGNVIVNSPGGVVVAPPPVERDTGTTGLGQQGQTSGRKRRRTASLLPLGLADTTRKSLLGT